MVRNKSPYLFLGKKPNKFPEGRIGPLDKLRFNKDRRIPEKNLPSFQPGAGWKIDTEIIQ